MLEGLRRRVLTSYGSGGSKTMMAALQSEEEKILSFGITWASSDCAVLGLRVRSMTVQNLLELERGKDARTSVRNSVKLDYRRRQRVNSAGIPLYELLRGLV